MNTEESRCPEERLRGSLVLAVAESMAARLQARSSRASALDSANYGGKVVWRAKGAGAARSAGPAPGLSNGHIPTGQIEGCQVEIWEGARLVSVRKPGERRYDVPARGQVFGQSPKARMRMMNLLCKIKQAAELPWFDTLTFPDAVPSPEQVKEIMDVYWVHVVRKFPEAAEVWKRELKDRKSGEVSKGVWVPHYHGMMWNIPERFPFLTMRVSGSRSCGVQAEIGRSRFTSATPTGGRSSANKRLNVETGKTVSASGSPEPGMRPSAPGTFGTIRRVSRASGSGPGTG